MVGEGLRSSGSGGLWFLVCFERLKDGRFCLGSLCHVCCALGLKLRAARWSVSIMGIVIILARKLFAKEI